MRSEEDILQLRLDLQGTIELDWERIEADPTWRSILIGYPDSPDSKWFALQEYMAHYLRGDRLLREMPSTNGPGSLVFKNVEVIHGNNGSGAQPERGDAGDPNARVHSQD